jgi:hypothetical protein
MFFTNLREMIFICFYYFKLIKSVNRVLSIVERLLRCFLPDNNRV